MSYFNILYWEPDHSPDLEGYSVLYGPTSQTPSEMFADPNGYGSLAAAKSVQYSIASIRDSKLGFKEEDIKPARGIIRVHRFYSQKPMCLVRGVLTDVSGRGHRIKIRAQIHPIDSPFSGTAGQFTVTSEVTVLSNCVGEWALPLIQNALVTLHIPEAQVSHRFIVPSSTEASITDIDLSPVELFRNN